MKNLKLVDQQYRAWSECTDVQASQALYWWQRLIAFGSDRTRVNTKEEVLNKCSAHCDLLIT